MCISKRVPCLLIVTILFIAFLPVASYAITIKGEVMHAADWVSEGGDYYSYTAFDFPVDPYRNAGIGDRDYIQVYKNGEPLIMDDDCTPDDGEACIEFETFGSTGLTEGSSWTVNIFNDENDPSATNPEDIYTVDYYWDGNVYKELLLLTYNGITADSKMLSYPPTTSTIQVVEHRGGYDYRICGEAGTICGTTILNPSNSDWADSNFKSIADSTMQTVIMFIM